MISAMGIISDPSSGIISGSKIASGIPELPSVSIISSDPPIDSGDSRIGKIS